MCIPRNLTEPLEAYGMVSSSKRLHRMVVNNFPMHRVRAMGRKLPGVVGSSSTELFPISLMAATFH